MLKFSGLVAAPLLGMVVFNLDRLPHLAEQRHLLRQFMPGWATPFLPGNGVPYTVLPPGAELEARVIEVYDGDTLTCLSLDDKNKYKLRLYGIDAPEAEQPFGDEARIALHRLLYGRQVAFKVLDSDKYGRNVAKVYCDNLYINLEMVSEGMAFHYYEFAKRDLDLPLAEEQARRREIGVWSRPNPEPPWHYRKRAAGKNSAATATTPKS
ncbi:MAG: thermonuclease family protein [Victivallaceae bacterium]|nr:thermonuclease family protein [Victivallaceae bacterium]